MTTLSQTLTETTASEGGRGRLDHSVFMFGTWRSIEHVWARSIESGHHPDRELWFQETSVRRYVPGLSPLRRQVRLAQPDWLLFGQVADEERLHQVVAECRVAAPRARLAMLGHLHDRGRAEAWVRRGCTLYLSHDSTIDRVLDTIKIASLLDLQIVDHAMYQRWRRSLPQVPRLTDRQHQVLELIQRGHTNADIAKQLFLTQHTVEFHIRNLLQKLGARNRTEAAQMGHALGIC